MRDELACVVDVEHGQHDVHEDRVIRAGLGRGEGIHGDLAVFGNVAARALRTEDIRDDLGIELVALGDEEVQPRQVKVDILLGDGLLEVLDFE